MLVGESASRARFEVSLKLRCGRLVTNGNRSVNCPWSKFRRMRNLPGIVFGKSLLNVFGHADIVMCTCRHIRQHVYIMETHHLKSFHPARLPPPLLRSYGATSRQLPKYSPPSRVALRRGTSLPLRVRLCLALRLAEPKLSFAERRLVEVGGVEPPSETALAKHLRV